MRVVAGRPDPIAQTPMMNAFIRYVALNPYWNSPPDITSRKLAPTILKEGRAYFTKRGYELVDPTSVRPCARHRSDVGRLACGRRRTGAGQSAAEARTRQFDGQDEVHVPQRSRDLASRHAGEGEDRGGRRGLQSNGCVRLEDAPRFARWLFNGRPPSPKGAKPEQKVNLPAPVPLYITYLTAVPSGTSIVYFDDFYGKDRAAGAAVRRAASSPSRPRADRGTSAASWSRRCGFSRLGARRPRSNWLVELDAELAGLRPAHDSADRADADDVDRRARSRARPGRGIRPARPSRRCCAASLRPSGRRCRSSRGASAGGGARGCRRSRPPRRSTLLASSRAVSAGLGLPEDVALDHADPELADQLKVVVGLDALGAGIHAERLGEGDDGADDRRVAVGRRTTPRRGRSSGRS